MTIAQQLKIKEFPFAIDDKNGREIYYEDSSGFWEKYEYDIYNNLIYFEDSSGYWEKREYDTNGNRIYFEDSSGYWRKREYDTNGNCIYYENSNGYWVKREWNANGNCIYFEDSSGATEDNRPKTEVQKAIELLTKEGLIADGKILKN